VSRLDGFLSRKLQAAWPDALVFQDEEPGYHARRGSGEVTGLGKTFHEARQAVTAIVAAVKVRGGEPNTAEVLRPKPNEPPTHEETGS